MLVLAGLVWYGATRVTRNALPTSKMKVKSLAGPILTCLVGALSVIVKTDCETDGSSAALVKMKRWCLVKPWCRVWGGAGLGGHCHWLLCLHSTGSDTTNIFLCFTHTKIFKSTLFLCRKLNETKRNFIYFSASVGSTQQQCIIYGCRSWDGCRLVWGSWDRDTVAPLDHTLFTATWILVEK